MTVPTVLVTGCAGYIGCVLTERLLDAGCRVIGVDNLAYRQEKALLHLLAHRRFTFYKADVREESKVNMLAWSADAVIPLAAIVGAPACDKNPERARYVNYEVIHGLVKSLSPRQRVLYPNTNSGYGATDGTSECTEESPLRPVSLYGETKCMAEDTVLSHPNGVAFRLATVFGVSPRMRMDLLVNDFAEKLSRIKSKRYGVLEIYEPHFNRNYVGVEDVADAFLFMIGRPTRGVFNLGLPTANMTKLQLAHRVCDVLGMSRTAVVEGEGKDPDQRNYLVSNDKILKTGFQFRHLLDRAIRDVARVCGLFDEDETKLMRNV